MKKLCASLLSALLLSGCAATSVQTKSPTTTSSTNSSSTASSSALTNERLRFKTRLTSQSESDSPVEAPPAAIFRLVKYSAPAGELAAYISPDPTDGKKHPAIIWITGGDCNSIGDVWTPAPRDNDQTAAAYRKAGIIMMFPSLRGGNDNPGNKEGFLGEVEDVLAARTYLEKQNYIDPHRIYLGGHSTGGTLALLVAESSNRFRSVFAFGPVDDVSYYGADSGFLPFDIKNEREVKLRSPVYWLDSIESPTWVLEGTVDANLDSLQIMKGMSSNPQTHFLEVKGATHFDLLAPTNELLARKILADTGAETNITLTEDEVTRNFAS